MFPGPPDTNKELGLIGELGIDRSADIELGIGGVIRTIDEAEPRDIYGRDAWIAAELEWNSDFSLLASNAGDREDYATPLCVIAGPIKSSRNRPIDASLTPWRPICLFMLSFQFLVLFLKREKKKTVYVSFF